MRSQSGVQVFSIGTSPIFPGNGCAYTCKYCSCEDNAPKSYNIDEPGMARAFQNDFKPLPQIWDRANTYHVNGHPVDKGEMIVIGGTWDSYPISYQEEVMTDIYYGANIYHENLMIGNTDVKHIDYSVIRKKLSLEEEMKINETSDFRIIGLTIETRPDNVTPDSIKRYRRYGVTRVQMGIQHIDDRVLERADRKCNSKKVIKAIKLLKDNCFKVDGHFMPDLCKPLKLGVSPHKEPIEHDDIDWDFDMTLLPISVNE
jgi:histone acetyltransferase (RNA polymerase elongator complex component)